MAWPPSPEVPTRSEIVLDNVMLVTPGLARAEHRRLVADRGRISAIEPSSQLNTPQRYILPGLVDMHVHLPPRFAPGLVDLFGSLLLMHGVTAVREVGSIDGQAFELARQIEQGERLGPRVVACGPILDGDPPTWPIVQVILTRVEGEEITRELAARGAGCVKVYGSVSTDALSGIRAAAAEFGMKIVGHVPSARPLSDSGLDDIQHLCYTRCGSASPEELEAFVASSAERGIAHTPTLVVFEGQRLLAEVRTHRATLPYDLMPRFWREALWRPVARVTNPDALASMQALVRRLHARGVRIHAGTDPIQPFVVPGASLHRELELLVGSGLSIEEALAAATWVAGESLGIAGLGRLEVGAPADLLLLRDDPTRDLAALDTLEAVIADGRLYSIAELRAAVDQQRSYFDRTIVDLPLRAGAGVGLELARRAFAR
jgi:cytosine/adenosine deaminase-related metal-dependent hydrolase